MKFRTKRFVSLLLASALTLSLAGCGGAAPSTETSEYVETEEHTPAAGDGETGSSDAEKNPDKKNDTLAQH